MTDTSESRQEKQQQTPPPVFNPYSTAGARNYALGVLTVVYSFNFIDRQLLSILLESIKLELSLSDSQLGLLMSL